MSQLNEKKILIMAGGTGGHIFPALATANVLKQKGVHIEWLGTKKGMESRLVPAHNFPINYINIGGLRGKGIKTLLLLPFRLIRAMAQTFKVYRKVKPDVVLGMGGFVTGPGGIVGWMTRTPLVLHEQNAIAGLTNKILFRFSQKVLAAFPGAFSENKKLRIIGNPVRKEIMSITKPEIRFEKKWAKNNDGKQLNILVVGGSLGAVALNEKLPEALNDIDQTGQLKKSVFEQINIRHQCGEKHLNATKENYSNFIEPEKIASIKVDIMPFIDDMAKNYEWADLVICRSGALTVSEIAAVGVASLLVPYPYAVDDHQSANAAYLSDEGAAFLVQQSELNSQKISDIIMSLDKKNILNMAVKARQLSTNDAAEVVANECLSLVDKEPG
ncbi:MAG: undecaprenyldiphospho-muramoylpentapeptide beta-N-acetylglucosaminyltransferase [Gammaproteobacteria bacterium]|nr:undecaprenyldiphospho-muramoylpentapeptide beta-N-acetylglucosaminyltransferase [Gammaproteobacteria bacterium]